MRPRAIICPSCSATSDEAARFCAQCGTFIGRRCPACETVLAAGAEFCTACGAILETPGAKAMTGTVPGRVEGERKHITVLFADMVGSTELLSDIGAERGRWLFEAVVDRMRPVVESFGGTVTQVIGDGIMALFGAPRALEDHALRACHAALRMQEAIGAEAFPEALGRPVAIRVGLHSGEVVVAERGHGFDHQYTAFGLAAHTAARLEKAARPGQVLISKGTHAQVAKQVDARPLGRFAAKGIAEPVESFVLLGVPDHRAAASPRGIGASFIGREGMLGLLDSLAVAAREGRGHAAVVVGEPGSGKSRLCREFLGGVTADFHIVQTAGHPFLPQPPYHGVAECLRAGLPPGATSQADIRAWLETLSLDAPEHAQALLPLLASEVVADPAWAMLSYRERQARIVAAVVHILRRAASERPVLVFIDDLQWTDVTTADVIGALARRIADAPILLLANARAGGVPAGVRDAAPTLIELDSFTEEETGRFLDAVPATAPVGRDMKRRLFQLTGGNPFFLEEVVKALHGAGSLDGALPELAIPGTVQDLLSMRIDRLSARSKATLQAAAVLGMEMESPHLAQMLGLKPAEMAPITAGLREAAFLLPVGKEGPDRLAFRHVLGRDAAYAGLLLENRQHLHARALNVLEEAGAREPGVLAFHAKRCADWTRAYRYSEAAGRVSIDRAAPQDAMTFFGDALDALGRISADNETRRAELDLRFRIRNTLFSLGRARDIGEHLSAARRLAEALGDEAGQARALCQSGHYAWQMGRWAEATTAGEAAVVLATRIGDLGLQAASVFFMGLAALAQGRPRAGAGLLARNVSVLTGELAFERFGFVSVCSVVSGSYLAVCLTELGRFEEAEQAASRARETALKAGSAFDRIQADLALAGVALMRGQADHRVALLEQALALCRAAAVAVLLPRTTAALALAYALAGRCDEALALVAEREEQSGEAVRAMSLLGSAEALLLCGKAMAAVERAEALVRFAQATDQSGSEAWGQLVLGSGHLALGAWQRAAAAADSAHAAAIQRDMRPLAARAALVRALAAAQGAGMPAYAALGSQELRAAVRACEAGGMGAWVNLAQRMGTTRQAR